MVRIRFIIGVGLGGLVTIRLMIRAELALREKAKLLGSLT
jgi:hypothetical protein